MSTPTLAAGFAHALDFTRRYDGCTMTLYECRLIGTSQVEYDLFFAKIEPEQGHAGKLYAPLGTFRRGKLVDGGKGVRA